MCSESINPDRRPLQIEQIGVNRLEGITGPYEVRDLCRGINLIYGPNASGKSRTAAAMQALIWPKLIPDDADLSGKLSTPHQTWNVFFTKQRREYQRNGSRIDPPDLSGIPETQHDRYLISLHHLLQSETGDFAKHIQRETAGGYDVAAAREACGLSRNAPKPSPKKLKDVYQDALGRRKQLRTLDQALQAEEQQLATLCEQLSEANAADSDRQQLTRALEYVAAAENLRDAETLRSTFQDPIGRMTGQEINQIERLNDRLRTSKERKRETERALDEMTRRLDMTGFAEGLPDDHVVPALRERLSLLISRSAELRKEEQSIAELRAQAAKAQMEIGEAIDDTQLQALDQHGLQMLAELQRDLARAQNVAGAWQELERWVGTIQPPSDLDSVRKAINVLSEWLRLPGPDAELAAARKSKLWLLLAAGLIVVEALMLAALSSPFLGALAVLAIPVALVGFLPERPVMAAAAEDKIRTYTALGLEPITDWNPVAVTAALERLRDRLAKGEVDTEKANHWANLEDLRREADAAASALAQKVQRVVDELCVSIDASPESTQRIAARLEKWRQSTDALTRAEAGSQAARAGFVQTMAQVNESLVEFGAPPATDEIDAKALIDALDERIAQARDARSAIAHHRHVIESQTQPQIDDCRAELDHLYQTFGLASDDLATVREWCEKVPACKEAQKRVENAQAQVALSLTHLSDSPELVTLTRPELELRLAEATRSAARRPHLQEEISRINAAIDVAKRGSSLEAAIEAESQALDALYVARTRDYALTACWQLANFVQRQTRDVNRPRVFHLARELLADFTAGSFLFDMDDNNPPNFRAIETASGKGRGLDELSSGTRVQLLMAVRLAFIETMEHGPQLPLLLDEILGNTDDVRANAVIDATIAVSRRGRQVIYFTAQQDEIAKWQSRIAAITDAPPHSVINLADVRNLAATERSSGITWGAAVFEPVRVPDGTDLESARRIFKVAPVNPWAASLDGVDLWYLIPDVLVLAKLRELGIASWGQFKNIRNGGIGQLAPSLTGVSKRADVRARALEAALSHWRIGRTAPLSRNDLESCTAITGTYIDVVAELAAAYKWDASELLEAIRRKEIHGFRRTALEELEEYLRTNGFVTDAAPLSQSEVRTNALLAVAAEIERGDVDVNEIDELLKSIGDDWQADRHVA